MLNNFRNLQSLFWSHGARWLLFRVGYALRKRTGVVRAQMPMYQWKDRPLETWLKSQVPSTPEAYAQWRKQHSPNFFFGSLRAERSDSVDEAQIPSDSPWNPQIAVQEAERILYGEFKYFAHKLIKTGFPPDWHKDPVSGKKLDSQKHWSEISDDGDVDIKFIWEASRFSMVYPLVRAYAWTQEERFAEAFWALLDSWAESNLPNTGPNWMDGQEAALRLMAWTFGYYQFSNSPSATPQRIAQFTVMVAAHAERIYKNLDYAISTRSNHTISEAFGLWLVGLLLPELRDAEKYHTLGRQWLEQEAAVQIFPDGTYSMYSLNYHRFILHIYFCMIRLGELNQAPRAASNLIYQRISASVDFLSRLIDPETGQMPVYGSNDGALVLPLNNCDFTDYRPLLQLGWYITKKQFLFEPGPWDEDIFWFYGEQLTATLAPGAHPLAPDARTHLPWRAVPGGVPRTQVPGTGDERAENAKKNLRLGDLSVLRGDSSPDGGVHILHNANSKVVIRCTNWAPARSRPSHADQLHVDLWLHGKNVACDAGTYLYSGEDRSWRNGLARTAVHNTVTVDHQDQMKMVSRFTWTNWAKGKVLRQDEKFWQGEHDGYKRLSDPVHHKRTVLSLDEDRWLVVDHLEGKQNHHYALHWLLEDFPYKQMGFGVQELAPTHSMLSGAKIIVLMGLLDGNPIFSIVRADHNSTRGWRSRYYGDKEPAISAMLEIDQPHACFWTFFGVEGDLVELTGNELKIRFEGRKDSINLDALNK